MSRRVNLDKRSEWLDRLRRFRRSNLSVTEFCRREEVSVASYYHWRQKLAKAASDLDANGAPVQATFLPVQIEGSAGLEVAFPNGARVTLAALDRPHVQAFIESIAMARTTQGGV
jgi:hypothetical protein